MAGIDNNTVLYLRGDSFKDLSLSPKTITNSGASINTDSIMFNGSSSYLSISDSEDFNFENEDFTIEFDVYLNALPSYNSLSVLGHRSAYNSNHAYTCGFGNNGFEFSYTTNGTTQITNYIPLSNFSINVFYNIAICRKDNNLYIFLNGTKKVSTTITGTVFNSSADFKIGAVNSSAGGFLNGKIKNLCISNGVARYTTDFTPPTKPFNSITINKTNQTDTNIEFNIEKLGQETINKVEVLVNGTVSETYTDNYDSIDYLIDTELCVIGNNDITIRVTFDDTYTEELSLTHNITIDELPLETPLLDTVERIKLLTNSKQNEKDMLSSILTSKNIEVSEEDKMSDLIGKVDMLGEYDDGKLWLYKDGVENILFTNITNTYGATVSKKTDSININANNKTSAGYQSCLTLYNQDKVNLSEYNKLKIEFSGELSAGNYGVSEGSRVTLGTDDNIDNLWNPAIKSEYICPQSQTVRPENEILELNISNINKETYIAITGRTGATSRPLNNLDIDIHKIWLEK